MLRIAHSRYLLTSCCCYLCRVDPGAAGKGHMFLASTFNFQSGIGDMSVKLAANTNCIRLRKGRALA
jgi:hypothetical protein